MLLGGLTAEECLEGRGDPGGDPMGVLEMEEGTEEDDGSVPVRVRVTMRCERLLCWWMSVAPSALRCMPTCTSWTTSPGQWAGLGGGRDKWWIEGCTDIMCYRLCIRIREV